MDEPGLVHISALINGISISRDLKEQFKAGTEIDAKAVTPGDLLFFGSLGDINNINDVGIYLGDGKFLSANSTKGYVAVSSFSDEHFEERLAGARRIFQH
jgi:N-acetylmuramoyl-L-alanine amidase